MEINNTTLGYRKSTLWQPVKLWDLFFWDCIAFGGGFASWRVLWHDTKGPGPKDASSCFSFFFFFSLAHPYLPTLTSHTLHIRIINVESAELNRFFEKDT